MMDKMLRLRLRSSAFIKSGFLQGRNAMKAWLQSNGVPIGGKGLPPNESQGIGGPKQIGQPKGSGTPAQSNWRARAVFENTAATKHDPESLNKYAGPALAQSFNEETADTVAEIARRLKDHARATGIRTA